MGQIYQAVNVDAFIDDYHIENFVETGTGIADSLSWVVNLQKDINMYSVEVMEDLYYKNVEKLKNVANLHLKLGYTHEVLPQILAEMSKAPTLFFHDAHFPGADFGYAGYGSEQSEIKRIPLEIELNIVSQNRNCRSDVFIIDDLRIYEDGPFEGGAWADRHLAGAHGIQFVNDLFGKTHHMIKSYAQQGFIILIPNWYCDALGSIGDYLVGDNYIIC
jgi:hypothetical protein